MIKNYFKTAWRSLLRNKTYAVINIAGLAVGITSCLLIFLVVRYETSFDQFHAKKDRIYRVLTVATKPALNYSSGVSFPIPEALRLDMPKLSNVTSVLQNGGSIFGVNGTQKFKEDQTYYADSHFFEVFDFGWLAGDKRTALAEPNSVALTQDEADRFFGDWHKAMGQVIRYKNKFDMKVTGILKNTPPNTDIPFKILISKASMNVKGADFYNSMKDWVSISSENNCFVVLPEAANTDMYNRQLDAFVKRHQPEQYAKGQTMKLQPLSEMHFNTEVEIFTDRAFSKQLINAISLIGLFLLIIACVNFINLATAQAVERSREVGIRKVLGSSRKQLFMQFMNETGLITFCAIIVALVIGWLTLPFLNSLLEIELNPLFFLQRDILIFLGVLFVAVTVLSGAYPALVLSGYNPITAFRNRMSSVGSSGISLRRGLVILQFGIAQTLIIGTLVVVSQLNYFKNTPMGFTKDAIITVPILNDSVNRPKLAALKQQWLQQPGVSEVSYSYGSPSDNNNWTSGVRFNNSSEDTEFGANLKWADVNYFKVYNLKFVAGGPYAAGDSLSGYVINETMAHKLGLHDAQKAVGKIMSLWGNKNFNARITGVLRDFNISSLKDAISPVMMAPARGTYQLANIKLNGANIHQTLSQIEKTWTATFPESLYEYHFVDEQIAKLYKADTQLSQLYTIFAGIAIFISCLGLFGLVSFMTVQRTKEVGIRRTLGATVGNIVYLFSKEFTVLVLVAFAIAAPTGWYITDKWLQDFAYKIKVGPGIFLMAIAFSVIIAWLTVGFKAVRAALADPIKSLKSE